MNDGGQGASSEADGVLCSRRGIDSIEHRARTDTKEHETQGTGHTQEKRQHISIEFNQNFARRGLDEARHVAGDGGPQSVFLP